LFVDLYRFRDHKEGLLDEANLRLLLSRTGLFVIIGAGGRAEPSASPYISD